MKYFLNTQFHEYNKQPKLVGINVGKPIDTIELISIGIVSEDIIKRKKLTSEDCNGCSINFTLGCELCTRSRDSSANGGNPEYHLNSKSDITTINSEEYYAICKEFDLKAAWSNEWMKKNVLKPMLYELRDRYVLELLQIYKPKYPKLSDTTLMNATTEGDNAFDFVHKEIKLHESRHKALKYLIDKYGKTRKQIAEEVIEFTKCDCEKGIQQHYDHYNVEGNCTKITEFYADYADYADYDWVVLCSLWKEIYPAKNGQTGMSYINPKGFPYYCNELQQMINKNKSSQPSKDYPQKQGNQYNALNGAKNAKDIFNFLNTI